MSDVDAVAAIWCVRSAGRGLCQGDVCRARAAAWEVADAVSKARSSASARSVHEHLDSLFEAWLSFEHPKAYDRVVRKSGVESSDGSAPMDARSMNEMIDKLRAAAAFAPQVGPDTMGSNMMPAGAALGR